PPRTELIRQPTSDQIAAERPQVGTCFRLENENSHHTAPLAVTWPSPPESNSATTKLVALRRPTDRRRPLVLVAKDHATLFQIVGRNFDGHPIAGQRFDAVFLHPAGGVGDQRMSVVELNAVARVGQDLGDQSLELQEFFFRHVTILLNGRSNAARGRRRRAPPVPGDAGKQPKRCRLRFPSADRYAGVGARPCRGGPAVAVAWPGRRLAAGRDPALPPAARNAAAARVCRSPESTGE